MQHARTPMAVLHAAAMRVRLVIEWHVQASSYSMANNDFGLLIDIKLIFGSWEVLVLQMQKLSSNILSSLNC